MANYILSHQGPDIDETLDKAKNTVTTLKNQVLTEQEKENARQNISAANANTVGALSSLSTTNKSTIVDAINSVNSNVSAIDGFYIAEKLTGLPNSDIKNLSDKIIGNETSNINNAISADVVATKLAEANQTAFNTVASKVVGSQTAAIKGIVTNEIDDDYIKDSLSTSGAYGDIADYIVTNNKSDIEKIATGVVDSDYISTNLLTADAGVFNSLSTKIIAAEQAVIKDLAAETVTADYIAANIVNASEGYFDAISTKVIEAESANIEELVAGTINSDYIATKIIDADTGNFNTLAAKVIEAESANIKELTVDNLTSDYIQTDILDANEAYIRDLTADNITADYIKSDIIESDIMKANYAEIDLANVKTATVTEAWIKDLMIQGKMVAQEGTIYNLTGLHIDANDITAGTLTVDRLNLQGEDGLYYNLNITSMGQVEFEKLTEEEQKECQKHIHADTILAHSITTDQLTVNNLEGTGGWINLAKGEFAYGDATDGDYISWQNGKLTIRGDSIKLSTGKTIQETIDDIEIGGRNLLLGSSKYVSDSPYTFSGSAKDSVKDIPESVFVWKDIKVGEEYIFQCETNGVWGNHMTGGDGNGCTHFYLRYVKGDGTIQYQDLTNSKKINTNTTGRGIWKFTVPDGTFTKCLLRVDIHSDGTKVYSYNYWNLKIESGNKATDWTPAPEDIDSRIESAESSITQNAENIKLKVSKDGVISSINQSSEAVTINATKINLQGAVTISSISSDTQKSLLKSDTLYYLATSSSSGVTTSTSGWTTTAQSVTDTNKYLWTYHKYTYVDNSTSNSTPIITGVYGDKGKQGNPGNPGTSAYTHIRYSDSSDGSNFVTTPTKDTIYIGVYTGTSSAAPTDKTSYTWSKYKGETGATGNGINSITYYYALTSTSTAPSASSITSTTLLTPTSTNKYLWQKEIIDFTDSSVADKTSILLLAVYGDTGSKGDKGDTGSQGASISSATITYQVSNSSTTTPTGTWSSTPPSTNATNPYLWTKTVLTLSTGATLTPSYSVSSTLEGVDVGGRNLITKSQRLHDVFATAGDSNWSRSYVTEDGQSIWKATCITSGNGGVHTQLFPKTSDKIGQIYTWSCKVKASKSVTVNVGSECGGIRQCAFNTSWQDFSHTWKFTDGAVQSFVWYITGGEWAVDDWFMVKDFKIESGNIATTWTPAPEDTTVKNTFPIYYASNSTTLPTKPTSLVTSTSTGGGVWTTVQPAINKSYPYNYTCIQTEMESGLLTCSNVILERSLDKLVSWCSANDTTYIDGGNIYANSINASKLQITATGNNLLRNTGKFKGWTLATGTSGSFDYTNGIFTYNAVSTDGWTEIRPNLNIPYQLVRNKTVVLSAEVKGTSGQLLSVMLDPYVSKSETGDRAKFRDIYLQVGGNPDITKSVSVTADGTWQTVYAVATITDSFFTGVSDSTVSFDSCYFGARLARTSANHNGYQVRHPQIAIGDVLTSWSPAPEDDSATIIDGGKIETGTITADKIAANSITAAQIKANSITADKLSIVQSNQNLILSSRTVSKTAQAGTVTEGVVTESNSYPSGYYRTYTITALDSSGGNGGPYFTYTKLIKSLNVLQSGETYTFSFCAKASKTTKWPWAWAEGQQSISDNHADGLTTSLKTYYHTFKWTNTSKLTFVFYTDTVCDLYLSSFTLVKGSIPAEWSLAPDDIAADATTKANAAESNAKSAAAGDATTKANAAELNAKTAAASDAAAKVKVVTDNIYTNGTTTINGGKITTSSITANKIRLGDMDNYCQMNVYNYEAFGFSREEDSSTNTNNPWFKLKTLSRDTPLTAPDAYTAYECNGGENFYITFQVSSTVMGKTSADATSYTYMNINIGLYGQRTTGASAWYIPYGAMSDANGTVRTVGVYTTLGADIRKFGVALQINGSNGTFSGTCKIRNVKVYKLTSGVLIEDGAVIASKIAAGTITGDKIKADTTITNHLTASNLDITGGSVNITTTAQSNDKIKLSYGNYSTAMGTNYFHAWDGSTKNYTFIEPSRIEIYNASDDNYVSFDRASITFGSTSQSGDTPPSGGSSSISRTASYGSDGISLATGNVSLVSGQVKKSGGGSWISDRYHVAVSGNSYGQAALSSYNPVIGQKTTSGYWSIGNLSGKEDLVFNYTTDTAYNNGTNTSTPVYLPKTAGTIALTSNLVFNVSSTSLTIPSGTAGATNTLSSDLAYVTGCSKCVVMMWTKAMISSNPAMTPITFMLTGLSSKYTADDAGTYIGVCYAGFNSSYPIKIERRISSTGTLNFRVGATTTSGINISIRVLWLP